MTNEQRLIGIQRFIALLPHCRMLKMSVTSASETDLVLSLEGEARFAGNAEAGLIHGGLLTVLMDTACGSATLLALPEPEVCPTLDLRMDHYQAAQLGQRLYCRARATRLTRQIVFTEGLIWQQQEDQPLAKGTGTFMRLGTGRTPQGFAELLFGRGDAA